MMPTRDVIALNRPAFGPSPPDRGKFRRAGLPTWLDEQLGGDHRSDPEGDARIKAATLQCRARRQPGQ
jgi:hypothetical protein